MEEGGRGAALPSLPSARFCPHPLCSRSQLPPPSFLISIKSVTAPCCCHPGTGATLQNVLHNPREETSRGGSWRGSQAPVAPPPKEPPYSSSLCSLPGAGQASLCIFSFHLSISLGGSTATILLLPITKLGSKKVTALETRSVWL